MACAAVSLALAVRIAILMLHCADKGTIETLERTCHFVGCFRLPRESLTLSYVPLLINWL